jgi:putative oxidoreductase
MITTEKVINTIIAIIRVLFGALMIFASTAYFLNMIPAPQLEGKMKIFTEGIDAAGYLMPLVKAIELACGMLFIANRFVALAALLILPIVVNNLAIHLFIDKQGLPVALFLFGANAVLIVHHLGRYKRILIVR